MKNLKPQQDDVRPRLIKFLKPKVFVNFYWLKQELIDFFSANKLSVEGSKAPEYQTQIGSQFKYNQFIRDFLPKFCLGPIIAC